MGAGARERREQRDGQTERDGARARAAGGRRSGSAPGQGRPGAHTRCRWVSAGRGGSEQAVTTEAGGVKVQRRPRQEQCEPGSWGGSGGACGWAQGQGIRAGARRARQAWDRAVTCWGPVNTQPKGLLSHAYEIGGSTEVLAPVTLGHIGQAEARVGLRTLTDPRLRGQETRLRRGGPAGHTGVTAEELALAQPRGTSQEGCLEEVWRHRGGRCAHTGHSCPSRTPAAR